MMRPLSQKIRFVSLLFLFVIFVIISPLLIAYSMGYRITDIDNVFTLQKTGGIYIHSPVSGAEVYLDGEFIKINGVLLRNTLIQNLMPDRYHFVEVHKEGYQSWVKSLPVYSSLVTEGRVLMLPKEITKREVYPFVDSLGNATATVPTKVTMIKGKPIPNNQEYRSLMTLFEGRDIYATSTAVKVITNLNATSTLATSSKVIAPHFVLLGIEEPESLKNLIENGDEVSWLREGNIILNWVGKVNEIPYYYCTEPEECRAKIELDWADEIKKFSFLPGRNDVFLVQVNSGLYAVEVDDRTEQNIQYVYVGQMDDFLIGPNNKIFIRQGDRFFELNV